MNTMNAQQHVSLNSRILHPALATALYDAGAGQCWSSPQEMAAARSGDFPHGTVDDCDANPGKFQRIWHDPSASWLNIYASEE